MYCLRQNSVCAVITAAILFSCTAPASAVILHPDAEPNLTTWTDRPDSNVVVRWSSNASSVVIAPNWILTTRHQGTSPSTVTIAGSTYRCHYKPEWTGGPAGDADIRLVRLTTPDDRNPNLPNYAPPYQTTDEPGQNMVVGGYGDGRGDILQTAGITYGYDWDNSTNTTLRFGTNRIDSTENDSTIGSFTSDIIIADFDGLGEGLATTYEATVAAHDSGGGCFIYDSGQWKLAGLSRAVGVHYEPGHSGDPNYILYQSWFRNRENPHTRQPEYLDAVRISSYATWILQTIYVEADLTADDWVDFADFSFFAQHFGRDDCDQSNSFCQGADFEPPYGTVDYNDLAYLADRWLTGWQY
jgi:hypothetical protein